MTTVHRRTKKPSERITYDVDFVRSIEAVWKGGRDYSSGEFVRPPEANGHEYQCTTGGQSGSAEPVWPTDGGTVTDGTVVWTDEGAGQQAVDDIATTDVTADAGITLDSETVVGTRALIPVSGGTAGQSYDINVKVTTSAGDEYVETLRITVRAG